MPLSRTPPGPLRVGDPKCMRANRCWPVCSLTLILSAVVLGCNDGTGPVGWVNVATLGSSFTMTEASGDGVPFTVVNRGMRTVYLQRCGDRVMTSIDRLEGTHWTDYSGDACLANVPSAPLELRSGERYEGTRWVAERGVYRFRVGVAPDFGAQADWDAASNRFSIE